MLAFLHIPKTAGTAARRLLEQRFASRLGLVYDRPPGKALSKFARMPPQQWAEYDAVVGHFAFGIHRCLPGNTRYVTFLRDPVERVVSLYFHNVHRPSRYHDRIHAEGIDLARFVRERVSCQVENSMTQFLAGIEHVAGADRRVFKHGCPQWALDVAKQNLEEWFDVVGIVERSNESFLLLTSYLGLGVEEVERVNDNPARPPSDHIEAHALDEIRAANQLDLALYEFAQERLGRNVAPGTSLPA